MCLTAKNFNYKKKTSTSPNRRERPLIMVRDGVPQKQRETYGQKEREKGDAVLYEK